MVKILLCRCNVALSDLRGAGLPSAGTGEMRKRYGFVYVDMDDDGNGDLSRSRKDSFYYMQKVYKSNGEDLD